MRYLYLFFLLTVSAACLAEAGAPPRGQLPAQILGVRIWPAPDNTRIVFDLNSPVSYRMSPPGKTGRIELDLSNVAFTQLSPTFNTKKSFMTRFTSTPSAQGMQVTMELKEGVQAKSFVLSPNQEYGHRLVVDLFPDKVPVADAYINMPAAPALKNTPSAPPLREIVVAIDAGHGGEDPGARGRKGTVEKDVVLAIARKLEALIKLEKGMRPVMIRDGDYFVSLRKRIEKARSQKADLFISIHADAFYKPEARGSSVFTLSQSGATNEASRWLASRENASDLVGGVSLDDKDELLASVLLDLSQTATIEASIDVGTSVLDALKGIGKVHKARIEQAGFVVLKSPDIPSILVETAFISNPSEETKLRDARHQQALASALMKGVRTYFAKRIPVGPTLAEQEPAPHEHIVARGETLAGIARVYQISAENLRSANRKLSGRLLHSGDVLYIPQFLADVSD
ncbi:MAG: N-acetylmuramoyl-L-alanine amidase [Gammaproteobacteria bacterium]